MVVGDLDVSDDIRAFGGFGDVRSGIYGGVPVAVKTMRVGPNVDFKKTRKVSIDDVFDPIQFRRDLDRPAQRFYREVVLWGTLSHPNVLKLVGVQENMKKRELITVSEWMVHGTIMDYIGKNHTNRLELVRSFTFPATPFTKTRQQLYGAAKGLEYLHGASLAHGDLKGVRVSQFRDRSIFDA